MAYKPMIKDYAGQRKAKAYRSPALEFAHDNEMITHEEYEQCLLGNMHVNASRLLNLNAKTHFPTGTAVKIYRGRAIKLMSDELLGLDISEKHFTQ